MATSGALTRCEVTNDAYTLHADASAESGGRGLGWRPHELLAAALASCVSIQVRRYAAERKLRLSSVAVDVEVDRTAPGKTVFRKTVSLEGELTDEEREGLLRAAETCPVQETLGSAPVFEVMRG